MRQRTNVRPSAQRLLRGGFTLVELLVVITILVILTAMTVAAVNFGFQAERIRSGARQVQSYLEGARDRAIYARELRGVRFLVDQTNNNTVTSMVYIGAPEIYSEGTIQQLERVDQYDNSTFTPGPPSGPPDGIADPPFHVKIIRGNGTGWNNLKDRGLLVDGTRIKIIRQAGGGEWYTVETNLLTPTSETLVLTIPLIGGGNTAQDQIPAFSPTDGPSEYQLELPPQPLTGEDPALLPRGIVIDLTRSKIPSSWGSPGNYSPRMDVLFTPRGTVTGVPAAEGILHFYLSDAIVADFLPSVLAAPDVPAGGEEAAAVFTSPAIPGPVLNVWDDRLIATVFTRTGGISTHPVQADDVDPNDPSPPPDGIAYDPFYYAEVGEVAGE